MTLKYVVFIAIPLVLSALLLIIKNAFYSDQINCSVNLFIGILSARNNSHQRQTIRKTWFQTIDHITNSNLNSELCQIKLKAKFIIGDKDCSIHPLFRTDQYSCLFNYIKLTPNNAELYLHDYNQTQTQTIELLPHKRLFRGFSFAVSFKISSNTNLNFVFLSNLLSFELFNCSNLLYLLRFRTYSTFFINHQIRHPIILTKIGVRKNFLNDNQNVTIVLLNALDKAIINLTK